MTTDTGHNRFKKVFRFSSSEDRTLQTEAPVSRHSSFQKAPQARCNTGHNTLATRQEESNEYSKEISGVVLAGGKSTRLGTDKAQLRLYGAHQPDLLTRTCYLLETVTNDVWVSGRDVSSPPDNYQYIPDCKHGIGPIAGITSALRATQSPVLVLSCDLPFMNAATLALLINARNKRPQDALVTTFIQEETGCIEALVAIYELASLPYFERAIAENNYKLSTAIPVTKRHTLAYSHKNAHPFFNVNYPADLTTARQRLLL